MEILQDLIGDNVTIALRTGERQECVIQTVSEDGLWITAENQVGARVAINLRHVLWIARAGLG